MFRSLAMPAALALALIAAPAAAQDASSLTLDLPLFASKDKKGTITYAPLKVSKGSATITVRFYDGAPDGSAPIHESQVVITAKAPDAPFAPGDQPQPDKVLGLASLTLTNLPADLLTKDVWVTTQASVEKGKQVLDYAESPARPLGLSGITEGRDLNPRSISIGEGGLAFSEGAAPGLVLTSDADGLGSWQSLEEIGLPDGLVGSAQIADRSILHLDIAEGAVGQFELESDSVATAELVDGAVTGAKLANGAVGSAQVADNSLTANDLAANSVGSSEIAIGAVGSAQVADNSLTAADLTDGAVTNAKLGADAVTSDKIASRTIVGDDIAEKAVGHFELATNAVRTEEILDGAVTGVKLANGAVGSAQVANNSLTADDLAPASVGFSELKLDSVSGSIITDDDLGFLNCGTYAYEGGESALEILSEYDIRLKADTDQDTSNEWIRFYRNQDLAGVQTEQESMRINEVGNVLAQNSFISNGIDVAENFPTRAGRLEPGTVVAVDPQHPEHVLLAERGLHESVLGIVSTQPGLQLGGDMDGVQPELLWASDEAARQGDVARSASLRADWVAAQANRVDQAAVALAGRVPVKVDLSSGPIRAGDRLGLGASAGVAAKWYGVGPVVGIATESWAGESATLVAFCHVEYDSDATPVMPLIATPVRGVGVVAAGVTSWTVWQAGLSPDSQPLVTMYGDAGSRHWIAERGHEYFVLEFAEPTHGTLEFGFEALP